MRHWAESERAFWLLPTWLIYRGIRRWLPQRHPWKVSPIPFDYWVAHATDLLVWLSYGIGVLLLFDLGVWSAFLWRLLRR